MSTSSDSDTEGPAHKKQRIEELPPSPPIVVGVAVVPSKEQRLSNLMLWIDPSLITHEWDEPLAGVIDWDMFYTDFEDVFDKQSKEPEIEELNKLIDEDPRCTDDSERDVMRWLITWMLKERYSIAVSSFRCLEIQVVLDSLIQKHMVNNFVGDDLFQLIEEVIDKIYGHVLLKEKRATLFFHVHCRIPFIYRTPKQIRPRYRNGFEDGCSLTSLLSLPANC